MGVDPARGISDGRDRFVALRPRVLADVQSVHHGHMQEIEVLDANACDRRSPRCSTASSSQTVACRRATATTKRTTRSTRARGASRGMKLRRLQIVADPAVRLIGALVTSGTTPLACEPDRCLPA